MAELLTTYAYLRHAEKHRQKMQLDSAVAWLCNPQQFALCYVSWFRGTLVGLRYVPLDGKEPDHQKSSRRKTSQTKRVSGGLAFLLYKSSPSAESAMMAASSRGSRAVRGILSCEFFSSTEPLRPPIDRQGMQLHEQHLRLTRCPHISNSLHAVLQMRNHIQPSSSDILPLLLCSHNNNNDNRSLCRCRQHSSADGRNLPQDAVPVRHPLRAHPDAAAAPDADAAPV